MERDQPTHFRNLPTLRVRPSFGIHPERVPWGMTSSHSASNRAGTAPVLDFLFAEADERLERGLFPSLMVPADVEDLGV